MSSSAKDNLYARSGVLDIAEFYKTKFVSDEVLDHRYFKPVDRFDIRFARTMWVYDNVRSGSSVLDLGCGAGMLALLKRKGVELTGVDLSTECAIAASRNGYDHTLSADLTSLPLPDASFDYVVSLDVLGHVEPEQKDAVITEIKRVLRPDGVTMHGIECTDRATQPSLDQMSEAERKRFVAIDGHVGLEEEQEHAARFSRFFSNVLFEPRYGLCLSSEEFLKQADQYGLPFERDFLDYLRGLSFKERRAFDIAMGYVFGKISELNLHLPKAGLYVLLKASDQPLGPFYNEHRDHKELLGGLGETTCLDRDRSVRFDNGWYEPDLVPPVARWMSDRGRIRFRSKSLSEISLDVTTHIPDLLKHPVGLQMKLNNEQLAACSLIRQGWFNLLVSVPPELVESASGEFEIELKVDRTWQPRPSDGEPGSQRDDRELSIAVCNIEIS